MREWWENIPDIWACIKDVLFLPFDLVKISLAWVNDILEVVNEFLIKISLILENDLTYDEFLEFSKSPNRSNFDTWVKNILKHGDNLSAKIISKSEYFASLKKLEVSPSLNLLFEVGEMFRICREDILGFSPEKRYEILKELLNIPSLYNGAPSGYLIQLIRLLVFGNLGYSMKITKTRF